MRRNGKWLIVPTLLVAVLFLAPRASQGQRRGGFSADSFFDRLVQSYGGSGDTLDYSRIPANRRFGPMPTSGTITREKFRADFEQRMQEMRSRGGFRSRGGDSGDRSSSFSRGGPPSMSGGSSNDFADSIFKRSDRNGDGRITQDEVTSSRMREGFQQYDTNRDGSIDMNEFRGYMQARFGSRSGSSDSSSSSSPPPFTTNNPNVWDTSRWNNNDRRDRRNRDDNRNDRRGPNPQPQEDAMPVVYRYGKLPKDIPSYWSELDTDKDGQIGLYEWRRGERSTKEFTELDLNGDGYLTADEWLRSQRLAAEKKAASGDSTSTSTSASASGGGPPSGNSRSMGRGNRGGSNSDRSNGGNRRGGRGPRGSRNSSGGQ
jgi:Ca2+-binding EF-hand superfamily protein